MFGRFIALSFGAFMFTGYALGAEEFTVKEIPTGKLSALKAAQERLDAATAVFAKAQAVMVAAEQVRDELQKATVSGFYPTDSGCSWTYNHAYAIADSGSASIPMRRIRKVEIRGRYALITDTAEPCGLSGNIIGVNATGTTATFNNLGGSALSETR